MKSLIASAAVAACLVLGHVAPAQALITRVWVSASIGADNPSCGAITTPCRTFQYVHDTIVAAAGEIDILDPGGYGPLTINKSLAIVNDGVGVAGSPPVANGAAITINAQTTDHVFLRGLTLNGFGTGQYGVNLTGGGALTIADCTVRQFTFGVQINPSSGTTAFSISNSIFADNAYGIALVGSSGAITGAVSQTTLSNNYNYGLYVVGNATVTVTDSVAVGNSIGFMTYNGLRLSRSVATGNGTGVSVGGGGLVQSYGDNQIDGNGTDVIGTLTPIKTR